MKLLEKIDSIDISDEEKSRIDKKLLDIKSLQFKVLSAQAPAIRDYDFWRGAQQKFRIKGFRDGHPRAIQLVLTRALEAHRSFEGRNPQEAWHTVGPIYRRSVELYIHDEMPDLYHLLRSEEFQESPGTVTEQILRCIVKRLPLYEATLEQVRELYELGEFERSDFAEEILSNAPVEAEAVRRIVDDGVSTMRREVASAVALTRSDVLRQLEQQGGEVASLKQLLKKTGSDLESIDAKVRALGKSQASTPTIQERRVVVSEGAKKRRASDQVSAAIAELQSRVDGLGRQFKEVRKQIDSDRPRVTSAGVKENRGPRSTTTALQVINKWSQGFEEVGVPSNTVGASWILLEVVRRSRVILTDKPNLLLSLSRALPEGETSSLVASPLWVRDSDWKDGLAFLNEDSGVPRTLVIEDFDVALQEAYLVPPLIAWLTSIGANCANRVVLVPSKSDLMAVSPRVLELTSFATHSAPYIRELQETRRRPD